MAIDIEINLGTVITADIESYDLGGKLSRVNLRTLEWAEVGSGGRGWVERCSVELFAPCTTFGQPKGWEVNWSAMGSQPVEFAAEYAALLNRAVAMAKELSCPAQF